MFALCVSVASHSRGAFDEGVSNPRSCESLHVCACSVMHLCETTSVLLCCAGAASSHPHSTSHHVIIIKKQQPG